jgi:urocanate hydratase
MKILILILLLIENINGFNNPTTSLRRYFTLNGYVPDGLSKEDWEMIKKKDKKKNLKFEGTSGMKFRSRSFKEFAKGREDGTIEYNMPMERAKEKMNKGLIRPEDIPYMQRPGGMPDNSDLKKKFKFPWNK